MGWNTVHVTTIDLTAWCFLRSWFEKLHAEGHDVTLVCSAGPFSQPLRDLGVRVVNIPISRRISPLQDAESLWRLYEFFRLAHADVVHTHTSKAGFLGRLAARLAGVPRIVHTMHEPPHNAASNPGVRQIYIWLERLAAGWADRIVTVSYANEREIQATSLVPSSKLCVIREGLDVRRYTRAVDPRSAIRSLGIADDEPVIGTVGRLEKAKGQIHLIRAMPLILERYPKARLVVVGGGVMHEGLRAEAARLGLQDRVLMTGFRDDMLELMQGFDLFVLPSLWEGLGIVLLEAMAFERPVVAAAVGGVQDVVVDGETGLLVPPAQAAELARAVVDLLADPRRAAALGRAGYQRLLREFRDDVANENMLSLYTQLLSAR